MEEFMNLLYLGVVVILVGIVAPLLYAIGLKTMADKVKLPNTWLAFIPILNLFTLTAILQQNSKLKSKISLAIPFILSILFGISIYTSGFPVKQAMLSDTQSTIYTGICVLLFTLYYWYMHYLLLKCYTENAAKMMVIGILLSPLTLNLLIYSVRDNDLIDETDDSIID